MVDKSKHVYALIPWDDIDVTCYCGESIHASNFDDVTDCYQEKCPNCGQRFIIICQVVAVKEDEK